MLGLCLPHHPPWAEKKKVNGDFVLWPKLMNSSVIMGKSTAVQVFSPYQVRSFYVVGDKTKHREWSFCRAALPDEKQHRVK